MSLLLLLLLLLLLFIVIIMALCHIWSLNTVLFHVSIVINNNCSCYYLELFYQCSI